MNSQSGLSLLELLFAMTILAVGMLALATVFPASYMSLGNAHARENAMKLIETGIEYIKTMPYDSINSVNLPSEDLDVDQDGMIFMEKRLYHFYENHPYYDSKTVVIEVQWLNRPRKVESGSFVKQSTSATIIFDRFF
ncbi:prepilin-type N-terminal cleavage/methylation domain-containing protein [bacterium]|nr:prepilin-type N-terminal cleavage/methylation domain-containing protein [candidate division CSSED10-310 bacterium]